MKFIKNYKVFIFLMILIFFLGFLSTIFVFSEYNIKFYLMLKKVENYLFLIIPFFTFFNLFIRFLRWNFLIRTFHIFIPARELLSYYTISYLGNATPFYIFYIFRIIPLLKRKHYKGFGIFFIDLSLDFLTILIFYFFYKIIHNLIFISLLVLIFFFFLHYYLRKNKIFNSSYYLTAIIFAFLASFLLWNFTALTFSLSFKSFGKDLAFIEAVHSLSLMNLTNFFSIIPGGIFFSGKNLTLFFTEKGFSEDIVLYSVFLERILTVWLTVLISILFLIFFRKRFISTDYHFNNIAEEYPEQIPEHIKQKVLIKKIEINTKYLPITQFKKGLDAGCGQGWYLKEMMKKNYIMYGIDFSEKQVQKAKEYTNSKFIKSASITSIPFPDNSFDFIYTINVLHHLPDEEAIQRAIKEFHRVLKKGSRLIIHEINVLNPLFRFYMSYVFPVIKTIDEGTEIWLNIYEYDEILKNFKILNIEYFTFLPDFLPEFLTQLLQPIEKYLENSKFKKFSAHYAIILEKL